MYTAKHDAHHFLTNNVYCYVTSKTLMEHYQIQNTYFITECLFGFILREVTLRV